MLRPGELKSMRAAELTAFSSRCDILANVGTRSGLGQVTQNWQPVNKNEAGVVVAVPCRIVPLSGTSERDVADETTSTAEASIILPVDTVVTAANRIRIVGGSTYEVAFRHPAQTEDVSLSCDIKLVE